MTTQTSTLRGGELVLERVRPTQRLDAGTLTEEHRMIGDTVGASSW